MRIYRGPLYGRSYMEMCYGHPPPDEEETYLIMMQIQGTSLKTPHDDGDQEFGVVQSYDEEADHVSVISHEGVPIWSGTVQEYYCKWILD